MNSGAVRFSIVTLFPEVIAPVVSSSILGRGQEAGALDVRTLQLREFAVDKHRSVDGTPAGGGAGMVLKVDVVASAVRRAIADGVDDGYAPKDTSVRFLDARGEVFAQPVAQRLASQVRHLILVCGRYEGFDHRCFEVAYGVDVGLLSIGDFILTGGELSSLVVLDAVARLLPGVLGNSESAQLESHTPGGLLEHRHYTRPLSFEGLSVPPVLLTGDHRRIDQARQKDSVALTRIARPSLLVARSRTKSSERQLTKILADAAISTLASVRSKTVSAGHDSGQDGSNDRSNDGDA